MIGLSNGERVVVQRSPSRTVVYGLIVIATLVAALPSFWPGEFLKGGDARFHVAWQMAFADLAGWSDPYPRWMSQMAGGLGSPVFFIYPPLGHWVAAILRVVPGLADIQFRLALVTLIGSGVGAFGFYAWMRRHASAQGAALAAIVYTLAPYHLFVDIYYRGAFAEALAFAPIPWLLYAIDRLRERERRAFVVLALATMGLLLAHVPSSIIVLPFAGIYAWVRFGPNPFCRPAFVYAAASACGVLLAGGYLGTALTHAAFINTSVLFGGRFESWRWLLGVSPWPDTATEKAILLTTLVQTALLLAGAWVLLRRRPRDRVVVTMVTTGVVTLVLMSAIAAPLWHLETPLNRIQFPWRILVVQTLAVAAVAGLSLDRIPTRRRLAASAVVGLLVIVNVGLLGYRDLVMRPVPPTLESLRSYDAPEYQLGPIAERLAVFDGDSQFRILSGAASVSVSAWEPRHLSVLVDAAEPTVLALRQFRYTGWTVTENTGSPSDATVQAGAPGDLLTISVPAGAHTLDLRQTATIGERAGWIASGLGVALLLAAGLFLRTRRDGGATIP